MTINQKFLNLWEDLYMQSLGFIEENKNNPQAIITELENNLHHLKQYLIEFPFQTEEEEIHFFKHQKPLLSSWLIFYKSVYLIELEMPHGSMSDKKQYLESKLERYARYSKSNMMLLHYFRSNATNYDHIYFVRDRAKRQQITDSFSNEIDYSFCTGYDFRIANFMAHEKLEEFINYKIHSLSRPLEIVAKFQNSHYEEKNLSTQFTWTAHQTALVELIYAIHLSKSLNHGEAKIIEIAKHFENMFNIKFSNIHRSFTDIKNRKSGRFTYIEQLLEELNKSMEAYLNK